MRGRVAGVALVVWLAVAGGVAWGGPVRDRDGFSRCPRTFAHPYPRFGNVFDLGGIGVKRMSCTAAYRDIRRLPSRVFGEDTRAEGFRCTLSGSGQPGYVRCVRSDRAFRLSFMED